MKQITKRFTKGQDLRVEIEKVISENNIKAGVIVSAVGSLEPVVLRMAGAKEVKKWEGEFEIVSITGTISVNGHHIHLSASDKEGKVVGGHLKPGCIVRTTVEFVVLVFDDIEYKRTPDSKSGFDELSF
jgi:uncharacterized protein